MVYIFDNLTALNNSDYLYLRNYVAFERLKKCDNYLSLFDRKRCIIAYLLLRFGLLREYNISEVPQLINDNNGKPNIKNMHSIHFNFSHSESTVGCGIDSEPIGIDVENMITNSKRLIKFVLSKSEKERYLKSPDRDDFFTRIWTIKESYIKNSNTLSILKMNMINLTEIENDCFWFNGFYFYTIKTRNYYLSICSRRVNQQIYPVTISDLINKINCFQLT